MRNLSVIKAFLQHHVALMATQNPPLMATSKSPTQQG
jgi:hypothetical protein